MEAGPQGIDARSMPAQDRVAQSPVAGAGFEPATSGVPELAPAPNAASALAPCEGSSPRQPATDSLVP